VSVVSQKNHFGVSPQLIVLYQWESKTSRQESSGTMKRLCPTDTLSTLLFSCLQYDPVPLIRLSRFPPPLFVFHAALVTLVYFNVRLNPAVVCWSSSKTPASKKRTTEDNSDVIQASHRKQTWLSSIWGMHPVANSRPDRAWGFRLLRRGSRKPDRQCRRRLWYVNASLILSRQAKLDSLESMVEPLERLVNDCTLRRLLR